MNQDTTRYVGKNGLEYLHASDAEVYGGGLSHAVEYSAPKIVKVNASIPEAAKEPQTEAPVVPSTEALEQVAAYNEQDVRTYSDDQKLDFLAKLSTAEDEIIKNAAKELSIKGFAVTGRDKLLQKIKKELLG